LARKALWLCLGNVRLNFVDHGEKFANGENGMEALTDRVKHI
jgi:hypothetical protein